MPNSNWTWMGMVVVLVLHLMASDTSIEAITAQRQHPNLAKLERQQQSCLLTAYTAFSTPKRSELGVDQ